jgi:hypothetical protein
VKRGAVVAAAGRRVDPADAKEARFPSAAIPRTLRRISDALVVRGSTTLVTSAACGADLLALTAAADLNVRRRVVLPFASQRFKATSVTDRPGDWGAVFDRAIADLQMSGDLLILDENADDAGYAAVGEAILDEAERIAREEGSDLVALVVWDGRPRPGVDLTGRFLDSARRRGFKIDEVLTTSE